MRLKRLIEQIPDLLVKGSKDVEITGLCANSSLVAPGDLFVAKKGLTHDGTHYISEAIDSGAVAILTDLYDPFIQATQLIHPNVLEIEAKLASRMFGAPSQQLKMVGVTGTNGKTTSSFLIKHVLDKAGQNAGLIGSVEWVVGDHRFPGGMTTPDVITCHKLLKEMVSHGCQACVMEVSSHALDQKRVGEIDFDIALFTSLSQDHLDYHRSMDAYQAAKAKLFTSLKENNWAIFNADEDFFPKTHANILTYGIEAPADLMAKEIKLSEKGVQFLVCFEGEEVICKSEMIGTFNVYNLLGAIGVALKCGIPLEVATQSLKSFKSVPGRLERVKNRQGLNLFVDFAHTPDALESVLLTLVPLKKGRLITVFGCGGDRDKGKREKMGFIASALSDLCIVTSDNPRSEDPQAIGRDILRGMDKAKGFEIEIDRKRAIEKAIEIARTDDIVLIAGKGHEKQQIFSHQVVPFDDVQVARQAVEEMALR